MACYGEQYYTSPCMCHAYTPLGDVSEENTEAASFQMTQCLPLGEKPSWHSVTELSATLRNEERGLRRNAMEFCYLSCTPYIHT
jgi:hypothetical protein